MTTLYKLTTQKNTTHNETTWGENVTHTVNGVVVLCGNALHAYTHPILAVLFKPIHAAYDNPRLWEAEGDVKAADALKVGCSRLTTVREMPLPVVSTEFRVAFAVLCALEVCREPAVVAWAHAWLSGADRSHAAAAAAAYAAARAAARAAAYAAWAAANTARAAADAARAAANAANAARAANAAHAAANAANAAHAAAYAAANAANAATLDFVAIVEKVKSLGF